MQRLIRALMNPRIIGFSVWLGLILAVNFPLFLKPHQTSADHPQLIEHIVSKIIAVDFTCNGRMITCEYTRDNSRHYVYTRSPYQNVPYVNEKWNGHLDPNDHEYVFDSKVPD